MSQFFKSVVDGEVEIFFLHRGGNCVGILYPNMAFFIPKSQKISQNLSKEGNPPFWHDIKDIFSDQEWGQTVLG